MTSGFNHEATRIMPMDDTMCNQIATAQQYQQQSETTTTNQSSQFIQTLVNHLHKLINYDKPTSKPHQQNNNDGWELSFERLKILDFLQSGSQGSVYYGELRTVPVAIKQVKDANLIDIRHLRELNHPNVIKFRGVSHRASNYYIIMEWCPYGTLYDHLHSGRQLSSTKLADFAQQIATGMKYLHSKKIVHRDLKTQNILLAHNDILKISDFGAHKAFKDKVPATSITYTGTHAYMAPEIIRSEPHSFQVDIWSYGVVLWEVIICEEPYKNLHSTAIVWGVGKNSMSLPIPSSFPEGYKMILKDCWQSDPSKRLDFPQICMMLKGAGQEISKVKNQIFFQMQAEWKREIRKELYNQKSNEDDEVMSQKEKEIEEGLERVQRTREKNNLIFLQLNTCLLLVRKEKEQFKKEKEDFQKEKEAIQNREKELVEKEEELKKIIEELSFIDNESIKKKLEGIRLL